MRRILLVFVVLLAIVSCNRQIENSRTKVNLIFDTDFGPDYDDVGALALVHALADSGYVQILATLSSNLDERVIPCLEIINTYYGRAYIPLGATKRDNGVRQTSWQTKKWSELLPEKYSHTVSCTSEAPDAVKVYREILSQSEDKAVTICSVGFLTNLRDLLESGPDKYSPLTGRELIERKVLRMVVMGGAFPDGEDCFNFKMDASAASAVIAQWPTEIIFSGQEIGDKIRTGKHLIAEQIEDNPVKDVYKLCMEQGEPEGRMSWDQTAALVAIKGVAPYYNMVRGRLIYDEDGMGYWENDIHGKDGYIVEKTPPQEMSQIIEAYMMQKPKTNQ